MRKGRTVLQAKRYGIHSCGPQTSLVSAIRTMVDDQVSSLVVEDEQGYLLGVITRLDIIRAHIAQESWASECVEKHMCRDVVTVAPQTLLIEAAQRMLQVDATYVVVVLLEGDKSRPVAMLTDGDLAYHIVKGG